MSDSNRDTLSHPQVWDNIPWFVNGRATPHECRQIESHLQSCAQCRDECELQRRVYASVTLDTNIECVPSASLQRLWTRIDAQGAETTTHKSKQPAVAAAARRFGLLRWLAAALAIESCALAALVLAVGVGLHRSVPGGAYRTVSSPAQVPAGVSIRAVFAPTMTLEKLQALLQDAQLSVVSGPTDAGVYSLARLQSNQSGTDRQALALLRASPLVRFAESVAPP